MVQSGQADSQSQNIQAHQDAQAKMVQLNPSSTSSTIPEMAVAYSRSWVVSGAYTCRLQVDVAARAYVRRWLGSAAVGCSAGCRQHSSYAAAV